MGIELFATGIVLCFLWVPQANGTQRAGLSGQMAQGADQALKPKVESRTEHTVWASISVRKARR
jgi:hypothetical protein